MRMYVAFLPADSELLESHILNKAASWVAGAANPMIHTEVVFVDRESAQDIVGRSCSIHYGGKVFLDQKRFSRKQWQFRSVSATKEQVKAAFKFCLWLLCQSIFCSLNIKRKNKKYAEHII